MSCIRFNLPTSEAMKAARKAAPKLPHSSPAFTETKLFRLELMARSPNFRERERAALDYNITPALSLELSRDDVESVRVCAARNTHTDVRALYSLSRDESVAVRGFLALNPKIGNGTRQRLADDESDLVRYLLSTNQP